MFLVDANVWSEPERKRPDKHVRAWMDATPVSEIALSVVVLGELRRGTEQLRMRGEPRHAAIQAWLSAIERRFLGRLVFVDAEIAHEWGRMMAQSPANPTDTWLAAQARVRDYTIVTRNAKHYANRGVKVLNPFGSAA